MPTFAFRGCRVVNATDPHGRILGFLDRCYVDSFIIIIIIIIITIIVILLLKFLRSAPKLMQNGVQRLYHLKQCEIASPLFHSHTPCSPVCLETSSVAV
jgi:hypothetical protein